MLFFFCVFIRPCACFFICAVVIVLIKKTVSRLSRSYPLLFAIKTLMVGQFGDL